MTKTVDELTVNWHEGTQLKVREIDKVVLTQGAWVTVAFLYQELDLATQTYRAPKVALRRYKKRGDRYVVDSRFTLTSDKQALDFAAATQAWFADRGAGRVLDVKPGSLPRGPGVGEPPDE